MESIDNKNDTLNEFQQVIKFWERKRILYNLITFAGGGLVVFLRSCVPNGISSLNEFGIIFFWLFGANVFYTFSWGFEMLLNYYFKIKFWGNKKRLTIFILGTLFSFVWMFILTKELP